MPLNPHPTRNADTIQAYPKRVRTLIQRCRRALGVGPHDKLGHKQYVGWLINDRLNKSRPTWRMYKAASVYFLEQEIARDGDPEAEEALELLQSITSEGCVKTTMRTSGAKLKKFPLRDYRRLLDHLDDHPSPWSEDLGRWLSAGMLLGLRPVEWGQAEMILIQGEAALKVRNAKQTNNRAHGEFRTLLMGGLTDEERALVDRHVAQARAFAHAGEFAKFYQGCAATLARVVRQIWPRRPKKLTLYSLRHQFAADAKASGLTTEEIAALMGHAVDTTATQHYGRKSAGLEMVRVRPDPIEVARVRQVFKQRFPSQAPTPPTPPTVRPGRLVPPDGR